MVPAKFRGQPVMVTIVDTEDGISEGINAYQLPTDGRLRLTSKKIALSHTPFAVALSP
jgi:hypothetical protein